MDDLQLNFLQMISLRAAGGFDLGAALVRRLRLAAMAGTSRIIYDDLGRPEGYVTWARLNKEGFKAFVRTGACPRYYYELNEGHFFVLLDVYASKRSKETRRVVQDLAGRARLWSRLGAGVGQVYLRSGSGFRKASLHPEGGA